MPDDNNSNDNSPELVLSEVAEVAPDDLSDEQTTFLQENADDLSDEQKETFKDALEKKDDDVDPEDVEPETRTTPKPKKKETDDSEDDDIDPDDEARINKVVAKQLKEAGVGDTKDQLEVDNFIRSKPEYSKYRVNALKYMKAHPSLVARDAVRIVSADDQQKMGARKEREASQKVKDTQGGGSSARKPVDGKTDWGKATPEEMAAKKNEILGRRV